MSNLDDVKGVLRATAAFVEAAEWASKTLGLPGDPAKHAATARALLGIGLDALRRTISVDDAEVQIQRLTSGERARDANASVDSYVDDLFDDDTSKGEGER